MPKTDYDGIDFNSHVDDYVATTERIAHDETTAYENDGFVVRSLELDRKFGAVQFEVGVSGTEVPTRTPEDRNFTYYIYDGTGTIGVDGKIFSVEKGDFVTISPDQEYVLDGNFSSIVTCVDLPPDATEKMDKEKLVKKVANSESKNIQFPTFDINIFNFDDKEQVGALQLEVQAKGEHEGVRILDGLVRTYYVLEKGCTFTINGKQYVAEVGDFFAIYPNGEYSYEGDGKLYESNFSTTGEFFHEEPL